MYVLNLPRPKEDLLNYVKSFASEFTFLILKMEKIVTIISE